MTVNFYSSLEDFRLFDPDVHFHYGCPSTKIKHWALYEPASQRFLFTSDYQDLDILQEIRTLCSSRYNLFLFDIGAAENYHANIMDNTCCENWSVLKNFDDSQFNESLLMHRPIVETIKLIPSGRTEISDAMIQEQKKWIQFVNYWVLYLKNGILNRQWDVVDRFIQDTMGLKFDDPSDFDYYENPSNLARAIRWELYLGKDIQSTQNKITELMSMRVQKEALTAANSQ
jgi:hypothetical protein